MNIRPSFTRPMFGAGEAKKAPPAARPGVHPKPANPAGKPGAPVGESVGLPVPDRDAGAATCEVPVPNGEPLRTCFY